MYKLRAFTYFQNKIMNKTEHYKNVRTSGVFFLSWYVLYSVYAYRLPLIY